MTHCSFFLSYSVVLIALIFGLGGCSSTPDSRQESTGSSSSILELPLPNSVKSVEVVHTGDYSEGVVIDYDGNIYFSHSKVITIVAPDGTDRIWAETGEPNGHKILPDGTHLVCDASHHAVLHLDASGKMLEPASKECEGKPLRGPNDLTLDPQGGFYFTDPGGLDASNPSDVSNPIGTIHYVDSSGKTHFVAGGLAYPNGIVITPDRKRLLVAESRKNRILLYELSSPGKVGPMQIFSELPTKEGEQIDNQPDGICLDQAGNLYVAHYGMRQVQVLDPNGKIIRRYDGGNLTTSNCAFGGPQLNQLYVTGGSPGSLFRLELGVSGLEIRLKKQQNKGI